MGFIKDIDELLTQQAKDIIIKNIADCGGKEVLFLGNFDLNDKIDDITPYAWGSRYSVPSIIETAKGYEAVVHNHPSGVLEPSDADISIANILSNNFGAGFYIIDNKAENLYTVIDRIKKKSHSPIDDNFILSYFQEDGYLSELIPRYEYRIEQKQMVLDIVRSFNENKFAVIEAGTGIGKSFAYLIPSIIWAKKNKEKVIISTRTINLQQQLFQKDLPLIVKDEELKIEYDFALGRGNFVCLRKLSYITQEDNILFDEEIDSNAMDALINWARHTETGLKNEYTTQLDNLLWTLISSDHEKCHKIKCPNYERCFYFKHKRRLASCDIIIVNHYLLAYDIFLKNNIISFDENALLPPFKHIVMDEAHHIEDIMSRCFTMEISNNQIYHLLREIYNPVKKRGILLKLIMRQNHLEPLLLDRDVLDSLSQIRKHILKVRDNINIIHLNLEVSYEKLIKNTKSFIKDNYQRKGEIRIRIENEQSEYYISIKEELSDIFNIISDLFLDIKIIFRNYAELPQKILDLMDMDFIILKSIYKKLSFIVSVFESFFSISDEKVYWIEYNKAFKHQNFKICNAPVLVGEFLTDALYSKLTSFVATSATLNVEDDFRFFEERSGLSNLPEDQKIKSIYKSSFLINKKALLLIPKGITLPSEEEVYRDEVITSIHNLLGYLEGGVLILFTSRRFLEEAYDKLKGIIPSFGKHPMRQGEMPRDHQLIEFKSKGNGVLFALDSFWEGIDVPGSSLQNIIIPRLPFKSPSDPIEQARYEYIEKYQRKNPFFEYALPKAVLLLKQGFGRLIRNNTDRGLVIILDNRIKVKRYGKKFIKALPECPVIYADSNHIIDEIKIHYHKDKNYIPPLNLNFLEKKD